MILNKYFEKIVFYFRKKYGVSIRYRIPYNSENKHHVTRSFYGNYFICRMYLIILFITGILINGYLSRVAYFRKYTVFILNCIFNIGYKLYLTLLKVNDRIYKFKRSESRSVLIDFIKS